MISSMTAMMLVWATALFAPATAVPSVGDRVVAGFFHKEQIPLTVSEATDANWTAVTGDCDEVSGRRFRLGERLTPTLIFDNTDHLVGLQAVVSDTSFPPYPHSNVRSPPFIGNLGGLATSIMAVHFKDPAKLCSAEAADHVAGSIGDRLWVRLGTASAMASDFEQLPLLETELQAAMPYNGFTPGACFRGMGMHYWRHLDGKSNSACADLGPLFLMYDRGVLVAFGLALIGTKGRVPTVGGALPVGSGDELFEFPRHPLTPFFSPQNTLACTADLNKWDGTTIGAANLTIVSTMHFALSDASVITCKSPPAPPPSSPPAPPPSSPPAPPLARVIDCAADEECPVGFGCSLASRITARMLLFSSLPPLTRGHCVLL